jgi:hypothetical protein
MPIVDRPGNYCRRDGYVITLVKVFPGDAEYWNDTWIYFDPDRRWYYTTAGTVMSTDDTNFQHHPEDVISYLGENDEHYK